MYRGACSLLGVVCIIIACQLQYTFAAAEVTDGGDRSLKWKMNTLNLTTLSISKNDSRKIVREEERVRGAQYMSNVSLLKQSKYPLSNEDYQIVNNSVFTERVIKLVSNAKLTVLAHMHIQKASGTALASTLATECKCETTTLTSQTGNKYHKEVCASCPKVKDASFSFAMTVNRNVGRSWLCGAHAPLSVMITCLKNKVGSISLPYRSNRNITAKVIVGARELEKETEKEKEKENERSSITVAMVVMIREPWARFLSECRQCQVTGKDDSRLLCPPDWQTNNVVIKKGDATKSDANLINLLSSVSGRAMAQFRQMKMIGGGAQDFNMRYIPKPTNGPGSRWVGKIDEEYQSKLLTSSLKQLATAPSLIIGISEKFGQTVCTLEAIYGHLYKFQWNSTQHSHAARRDVEILYRRKSDPASDEAYLAWEAINKKEISLYEAATVLFERQWETTLVVLQRRLKIKELGIERIPHCLPFLGNVEEL